MANSPESNSVDSNVAEKDTNPSLTTKVIDVHPMAFTIEFNDQKVDEVRKSKVHERLSAFSLKHRRNPSLPDFGVVKNAKSIPPVEKLPSPLNSQHVPILNKGTQKTGKPSWKSSALKAVKNSEIKSPVVLRRNLEIDDVKENFLKHLKNNRRNSLNEIDISKMSCQNLTPSNVEHIKNGAVDKNDELESKSDTVSEAGTYTVDKEEESPENDTNRTQVFDETAGRDEERNKIQKNYHSSWINDWVRDVEEQNMLNPAPKEPSLIPRNSRNGSTSPGASKIPSPINTLSRKSKLRAIKSGEEKSFPVKLNGSALHRRSSSLSAKDYNDHHGSESSLETESFLRTTESVVTAMQNRMRLSLDGRHSEPRKLEKRDFSYKERPHPPSTASDTDTNSETDAKTFKKPIGNPFTSARLNRAFSLRRAKADPENELGKKKTTSGSKGAETKSSASNTRSTQSPKGIASKPPSSAPFSRTDCGRFSMRSTISSIRSNLSNQTPKKEVKKSNAGGGRSTSSLSSREVEFQNWRRRKSFDPMKAAAEGRKKELAKKAALNQSMTQSVNLGNGTRSRSGNNPVLRSASFHSTAQVLETEDDEREEFLDQGSTDEHEESAASSWLSNHHSLPHNSPTQSCAKCAQISRTPVFSSRCSLISETHSSPSHRVKSDVLDNLVMTAISDLSYKLKMKSCNLLKKLNYLYDPNEEKAFRLRDEIAVLESRRNSANNSPIHQAASRDLSAILKNLKGLENVLKVLDDVLFQENLEIYVNE